jgi:hypothetical protein
MDNRSSHEIDYPFLYRKWVIIVGIILSVLTLAMGAYSAIMILKRGEMSPLLAFCIILTIGVGINGIIVHIRRYLTSNRNSLNIPLK